MVNNKGIDGITMRIVDLIKVLQKEKEETYKKLQ